MENFKQILHDGLVFLLSLLKVLVQWEFFSTVSKKHVTKKFRYILLAQKEMHV